MPLPVFESLNVTSGRTTPTLVGVGSRSQILGRGRRRRGQTLDRNLVVSQVRDFSFGPVFIGSFISEDDILSGLILENGCDCTSETTEGNLTYTYYAHLDYMLYYKLK